LEAVIVAVVPLAVSRVEEAVEVLAALGVEALVAAALAEAGKLRQAQLPFDKRSTEFTPKSQLRVVEFGKIILCRLL
jgi:hypothetical protein